MIKISKDNFEIGKSRVVGDDNGVIRRLIGRQVVTEKLSQGRRRIDFELSKSGGPIYKFAFWCIN